MDRCSLVNAQKKRPYLRCFRVVSLLLISLLFITDCSRKITEVEPDNNIRKQAMKVEPKQVIRGTFYSEVGSDLDYYYITTETDAMIKGKLTAVKGVDSEILFYRKGDVSPYKVVNDNQSSLEESFGPYLISPPGVVLAVLSKTDLRGKGDYEKLYYEFSYEVNSVSFPTEVEGNDTIDTANSIDNGKLLGYYNNIYSNGSETEKDFYRVEIPENSKYRLSAFLSGVNGIDGVLRLYSAEGEKLLMVDEGGKDEGEKISSYGVQGPATFFFSVDAKDLQTSLSEYYSLEVRVEEYDPAYEFEPNDLIDRATPVSTDKIFGDFSGKKDIDFFRYYNNTSQVMVLRADIIPATNYNISARYYPVKNGEAVEFDDLSGEGNEVIANRVVKPLETVYFSVQGDQLNYESSYTINISTKPFEDTMERESNDTRKNAGEIGVDESREGYLNPASDLDLYQLKLIKGERFLIMVESPLNCEVAVDLYDKKGVKTETLHASGVGENLESVALLESGGYLSLYCGNVEASNEITPYRLLIKPDSIW